MTQLILIQAAVNISDPVELTTTKAYKFVPPQSVAVPGTFWMNEWTLVSEDRNVGMRDQLYSIHMQLLHTESSLEQGADVVSALHGDLVDRLDANVTLTQTVSNSALRGGSPTLVTLQRAGGVYIGLDLFLDVRMIETQDFT